MFYQFIQIVGLSCVSSVMHLSMSNVYWHICQVVPVRARAAVSMIPCGYWTLRVYRKGCSLTSVFDWLTGRMRQCVTKDSRWLTEWMSFLLFSGQTGILLAKSSLSLRFLGDRLSLELLLLLWATPSLCHFFSELLFCPHSTETPTHQHLLAAQQFPCVLQAPAAIPHRAAPWAAPTIPLHPHSFPMFPHYIAVFKNRASQSL